MGSNRVVFVGAITADSGVSPVVLVVKNPPMQETKEVQVQFLGWQDPLEEGTATRFWYSCLEIPHGTRSLAGYGL